MEELKDYLDDKDIADEGRHRELLRALNKLKENIPNGVDLTSVDSALNELKTALESLSINPEVVVESPQVNVDLSELKGTMDTLIKEIRILGDKIDSKPTEWSFEIDRNKITKEISFVKAKANG